MESEGIGDVPAFLSKWKLRKYKEFKDPLSVLRKKTRRKTNDLLKKGIIQKQPCIVCGKHDVIAHHEDYSRANDAIWICEEHHKKYHDGKIGLFKNKLWWNPKRLLPRSMRNGNMPEKYQKLKSQFKKKWTAAPNKSLHQTGNPVRPFFNSDFRVKRAFATTLLGSLRGELGRYTRRGVKMNSGKIYTSVTHPKGFHG